MVINHLVNQVQPRQENRKNNEYAMTLYQFNVLSEDEKAAIVWSKGDFVIERKENNFSILYQIDFEVSLKLCNFPYYGKTFKTYYRYPKPG